MDPWESQGKVTWETMGTWLGSTALSSLEPWYRFCVNGTHTWGTHKLAPILNDNKFAFQQSTRTCSSCWMKGTRYNCVAVPYSRQHSSLVSKAIYGLSSASVLPILQDIAGYKIYIMPGEEGNMIMNPAARSFTWKGWLWEPVHPTKETSS